MYVLLHDLKSSRLEWSLYQPVKLLDFPIHIVFIKRRFCVQLKTRRNRSRNEGNETLYSARALQLSNSKGTQEVCSKTFIRVIECVTDALKMRQ